jgi:tRNA (adenine22-N1)-methyltransferase
MELSGRLRAIAEMVPHTGTVADIGCDHGKLAVWLMRQGWAQRVICGDISTKSLNKARRLAEAEGLSGQIDARAGSGLGILTAGEADAAVIAGMGGELIVSILEADRDKAPDTLVLSCHTSADVLRGWLAENGYYFEDETLVEEKGHFYPVMRLVRGQSPALTGAECEFGPVLLQNKPEALRRLVEKRIRKIKDIRSQLERADSPRKTDLLAETKEKLTRYEEVLRCL